MTQLPVRKMLMAETVYIFFVTLEKQNLPEFDLQV